jgi:hypothetical protein
MELHPDERPESIEAFRQFLFGTKELPARPMMTRPRRGAALEIFFAPPESVLLGLGAALLLLSLIATLGH